MLVSVLQGRVRRDGVGSCDCFDGAGTLSVFFFLMSRRPPRSTLDRSSAASDVYKRQRPGQAGGQPAGMGGRGGGPGGRGSVNLSVGVHYLSLIHISEPTRPY